MFDRNPSKNLLSVLITPVPSVLALNAIPHLQPRQATSLLTCNQDNQLRALERFSTQASTFCPTYLASTTSTGAAPLPNYVSNFLNGDISSACSCFQASATETAVVLTFLAPTSIPSTPTPTISTITTATATTSTATTSTTTTSTTTTPTTTTPTITTSTTTTPTTTTPTTTTPTTTTPTTTTPTTTTSTTTTATPTPFSSPNKQKAGLATGAKAGIGIACAVLALLAIGIGTAMVYRRRKRTPARKVAKRRKGFAELDNDFAVGSGAGAGLPVYDAVEKDAGGYNHEVEGGNRFELSGDKTGGG